MLLTHPLPTYVGILTKKRATTAADPQAQKGTHHMLFSMTATTAVSCGVDVGGEKNNRTNTNTIDPYCSLFSPIPHPPACRPTPWQTRPYLSLPHYSHSCSFESKSNRMLLVGNSSVAALAAALLLILGNVESFAPPSSLSTNRVIAFDNAGFLPLPSTSSELHLFTKTKNDSDNMQLTKANGDRTKPAMAELSINDDSDDAAAIADNNKKLELIFLGIWGVSICAFILINNFYGPWPLAMKSVPERVFFLSHMIGGMLFGGGIILTTCIERAVAKSNDAKVLKFWFTKVPELDGLIVVPALTISMVSGTGLSIVRYGGLNIAPPHVGAIFWTLIAFMAWWATTDLTTQTTSLKAVQEMYEKSMASDGKELVETPKVVVDRHFSNVVSCFFVLTLYSMMVLKPGTLFPFPWSSWT